MQIEVTAKRTNTSCSGFSFSKYRAYTFHGTTTSDPFFPVGYSPGLSHEYESMRSVEPIVKCIWMRCILRVLEFHAGS